MASPLTLLMPVIPGTNPQTIAAALAGAQAEIDKALTSIGTVHYARFLLLDRSTPNLQPGGSPEQLVLAVITEYDGSFDDYIGDFVSQIGDVFNALLQFVVGGAAVTPVQSHPRVPGLCHGQRRVAALSQQRPDVAGRSGRRQRAVPGVSVQRAGHPGRRHPLLTGSRAPHPSFPHPHP